MGVLKEIKEAIPSTPVIVVSKSYCPFCRRAKGILETYQIDDTKMRIFEIDQAPDMGLIQAYMGQITGGTTVST